MRRQRRDKRALIERVKDYLARATTGRLGVDTIARAMGVSASYLAHAFRAIEKIPLYRYELQSRLRRGAALLASSEDLAGLALELGFASHSHFSTAFLQWSGCTPSAYRKSLLKCRNGQLADTSHLGGVDLTGQPGGSG